MHFKTAAFLMIRLACRRLLEHLTVTTAVSRYV